MAANCYKHDKLFWRIRLQPAKTLIKLTMLARIVRLINRINLKFCLQHQLLGREKHCESQLWGHFPLQHSGHNSFKVILYPSSGRSGFESMPKVTQQVWEKKFNDTLPIETRIMYWLVIIRIFNILSNYNFLLNTWFGSKSLSTCTEGRRWKRDVLKLSNVFLSGTDWSGGVKKMIQCNLRLWMPFSGQKNTIWIVHLQVTLCLYFNFKSLCKIFYMKMSLMCMKKKL